MRVLHGSICSACLLLVGIFGMVPAALAQAHAGTAAAADAATFQPDATLSREMAAIRASLEGRFSGIEAGTLDAAAYGALGRGLQDRVETIIRECELPAAADAVLHGYLGRMLAAAATLRRPDATPAERQAAALAAIRAYNDYGTRFRDGAWRALRAD